MNSDHPTLPNSQRYQRRLQPLYEESRNRPLYTVRQGVGFNEES